MRRTMTGLAVTALVLGPASVAVADSSQDYVLTVAVPSRIQDGTVRAGAIDNRTSRFNRQLLTEPGDGYDDVNNWDTARFGAAMLIDDLDDDGYDDLIVGAPGMPDNRQALPVPGAVHILFGTEFGISQIRAQRLATPARAGDEFGSALSLSTRVNRADGTTSPVRDLWIGAPGHDVDGKADSGAVFRYSVDAAGVAEYIETVDQDSPLVPGVAEAGDRFGEVLAAYSANGTVVGVPHEDVGEARDAGTVQRLRTDPDTDAVVAGEDFNQDAPGVPGTAEKGDLFGTAVTGRGTIVGVPGEDVGSRQDAGMLQHFDFRSAGNSLVPRAAYTQNSPGVPGVAEAGDRFGAAVSYGIFQCDEHSSAAIGAPGEDVGRVQDAGSVTLLYVPDGSGVTLKDCPARTLIQGRGLPGTPETGDQVGAAVSRRPGDPDRQDATRDTVMVGVPGEDIGTKADGKDSGRAVAATGGGNDGRSPISYRYQNGDHRGIRFGSYFVSW